MNIGAIILLIAFILLFVFEITSLVIKVVKNQKEKKAQKEAANSNDSLLSEQSDIDENNNKEVSE